MPQRRLHSVEGAAAHRRGRWTRRRLLAEHGIAFGAPKVDLDKLRGWKDKVVGKLTGGLAGMAKARKVEVVRGYGSFLDPHHLEVELTEGTGAGEDRREEGRAVREGDHRCRLAGGAAAVRSRTIRASSIRPARSTSQCVPKRMLVVGGGIIGLEMGTVYSTLGARLDVVEMMDGLMLGADRDLVRVWEKMNKPRFDRIMLKTKTVAVEARKDAIYVTFEGEQAPSGPQPYDLVLMSVGRSAERQEDRRATRPASRSPTAASSPSTTQMRTNVPHIYAIGDIVGQPMLAHKAVHEGHVAAEAAAGRRVLLRRAGDSVGRVHRSRDRVGRRHRGRGEGERDQGREEACSRGLRPAARSRTAATKASRSCCSTTRRIASSAAASSARTPAI